MKLSSTDASFQGMEYQQQQQPLGALSLSSSLSLPGTTSLDHVRLPFAYKLHLLLCDMEINCCEHIISWVEEGRAFKIHDPQKFEALIQPRYFRQSKITSFIRQCYVYGFSKIEFGPGRGSYVHPDFQRDNQAKCLTIQRQGRHHQCALSSSKDDCIPKTRKTRKADLTNNKKLVKATRNVVSPSPRSEHQHHCVIASPRSCTSSDQGSRYDRPIHIARECLQAMELPSSLFVDNSSEIFTDQSVFEPRPIELMLRSLLCQDQWSPYVDTNNDSMPQCRHGEIH